MACNHTLIPLFEPVLPTDPVSIQSEFWLADLRRGRTYYRCEKCMAVGAIGSRGNTKAGRKRRTHWLRNEKWIEQLLDAAAIWNRKVREARKDPVPSFWKSYQCVTVPGEDILLLPDRNWHAAAKSDPLFTLKPMVTQEVFNWLVENIGAFGAEWVVWSDGDNAVIAARSPGNKLAEFKLRWG